MANGKKANNKKRIARVTESLVFYKGEQLKEVGAVDRDTVTDFLTDLRHYCEKSDLDIEALFQCSLNHYLAETSSSGE